MSKRARHQPGFYATLLNDVRRCGYNLKYRPKLKPTVMGVYEVERIVAKLQGGRAEYFIQWQSYFPSEILREQICQSISRQWMAGETSSFIWEGFKIAPDVQRNYHDTARCSASALSWFALRPPWVSVPRQWRGTDSSRPWSLSEEVFNNFRISESVGFVFFTFLIIMFAAKKLGYSKVQRGVDFFFNNIRILNTETTYPC